MTEAFPKIVRCSKEGIPREELSDSLKKENCVGKTMLVLRLHRAFFHGIHDKVRGGTLKVKVHMWGKVRHGGLDYATEENTSIINFYSWVYFYP